MGQSQARWARAREAIRKLRPGRLIDSTIAQEALIELPDPPASPPTSYVRRSGGRPRRKNHSMTSVSVPPEERELLEGLAAAEGVSLNQVWRQALRAYGRQAGFTIQEGAAPR